MGCGTLILMNTGTPDEHRNAFRRLMQTQLMDWTVTWTMFPMTRRRRS
jgi:hypothetical protein